MRKVLWIPTPPSAGIVSMQRCFGALDMEVSKGDAEGLGRYQISPLVPFTGLMLGSRSRLAKAVDKWLVYRWRTRRAGSFDVVHALAHGSGHLLSHLQGSPRTLVTVHDLIPLRFRGGLSEAQIRRVRIQAERLAGFDLINTVSRFVAKELTDLIGIPPERIRVVENGIDQQAFRAPLSFPPALKELAEKPYVLTVSSAIARKNLRILPEVFGEVFAREPELRLVHAGSQLPDQLRDEFHRRCGCERLIELGRIPDEVLIPAYQKAAVFFFPSLYEGFGLPVIEAMASGTPVVCSNTTSLPEVGGEAALYFDPSDPSAGAAGILEALGRRDELVAMGFERSKPYTWQRSLEGHLKCYDELLS